MIHNIRYRVFVYENENFVECGSRDSNPGRPVSTGPKPVPFGLSGTPALIKTKVTRNHEKS